MRRNRFETLKKYVHCSDNNNLEENNKFAKLQPLFNMLNERFLSHAPLSEKLCIDESIVPYFGKHGAKQYIKGNPIRYGYKIWSLCGKSGYPIQFDPYQGKQANRRHMELGLGGSVVMTLLEKLPKEVPFKIYGDRYFSSLKLVNLLQKNGVGY
ncbi:hypothetical protein NQ314_014520 [Rhamnusium bicolor]|uniref:PiggyBac transposable element-derived protein domain-containing protein n=1 Tax=Rhamnusium bicolor TaxID=1586634 RepID=A0AAV8X3Z3_9CUCU|nr:hypothetical protein NQ314_014520 [Rhamnusium bicolor]